jgi:3-oxoacyl-(acyl-carrier-protein) synthase
MKTVISGFGCICSLGDNTIQIKQNLYEQNIKPTFPSNRFVSSFCNEYPVFQVSENVLSQKRDDESLSFLFLRKALNEALEKAQIQIKDLQKLRIGVCIGASVDASFNCFDFYKDWRKNNHTSLYPLDKHIKYSIAQEVLNQLNLKGISQTIVTACASGTDAIGIGAEWIENDFCDIVFAGGADELNLIPYTGFIKLMVASKAHCKPFDKNRNGINLGEGAAVFVLEKESSAMKRKIKKQGTVLGYGSSCDGYHITSPRPDGRGLRKAISFALKQAQLLPSEIAFINAHATASIDNDLAESKVFNDIFKSIPVSATKGLTGHTLGAAGAVEACLTLINLNEGKITKTKNFEMPDEKINLVPTLENTKIDLDKVAISDSLSFGGCNSALVLGGAHYE